MRIHSQSLDDVLVSYCDVLIFIVYHFKFSDLDCIKNTGKKNLFVFPVYIKEDKKYTKPGEPSRSEKIYFQVNSLII